YFINGVGVGFDGMIVKNMLSSGKMFKGMAAYYYQVIKILGTYKSRKVVFYIDGKRYEEKQILMIAANGTTFGGGFKLAPDANISNGQLSVCTISQIAPMSRFYHLNKLKKGKHTSMPQVTIHEANEIIIEEGEVVGQADGEFIGKPPFHIRLNKNKLKVIQRI
ncbi:MAG: hypothetical protein OEY34_00585, partial [Cyclobacteriaceae bacterium]|nr:hypothetical protein [Cyclobacteriaceae bacterium]